MAKRALLIGVDQYEDPNVQDLSGCVNDVNAATRLLTDSFGFDPGEITALTKPEETTRERIFGELEALIERTTAADVVCVYYSGHGSQAPDGDKEESDGLDETIVPSDSGRGGLPVRDITDDELHSHIAALARKSAHTSFIFDSCHSGTVDRGGLLSMETLAAFPDSVVPRAIPPAESAPEGGRRIYPLSVDEEASRSSTGLMPQGDYLMIGGCLDRQTSKEKPIDGEVRGALSYFLARELGSTPTESVEAAFTRAARALEGEIVDQTPVLEGPLRLTRSPAFSASGQRSEQEPAPAPAPETDGKTDPGTEKKQETVKKEPGEWDDSFARFGAYLVVAVFLSLAIAMSLLTRWLIASEPSELETSALIFLILTLVGFALAALGAYIGLIEARGRQRALQQVLGTTPTDPAARGAGQRAVLSDSVKEVKGIFEALGKMPTARALIAVAGIAFVAAAAFAWHTVPDATAEDDAPEITAQPSAVTATVGGKAFFRVTASGDDLAYAWQRNGREIDDAGDQPTLFLSPLEIGENGDRIAVSISNEGGETVSEDVLLSVAPEK